MKTNLIKIWEHVEIKINKVLFARNQFLPLSFFSMMPEEGIAGPNIGTPYLQLRATR